MDTAKRDFHLGDILSITHDRLVSLRHMDGIYDICNYLTQDSLYTHQLVRVHAECKAWLLQLHPQLNEIPVVADEDVDRSDKDWWRKWLAVQVQKYGETLSVEPIPKGIHAYRDPIEEAIEMVGADRVIIADVRTGEPHD